MTYTSDTALVSTLLHERGWVLLSQALPAQTLQEIRLVICEVLAKYWDMVSGSPGEALIPRVCPRGGKGVLLTGLSEVCEHASIREIEERGSRLVALLFGTFCRASVTAPCIRVMGKGERTEEHVDSDRYPSDTPMYTMWIPLDGYTEDESLLFVVEGSHRAGLEQGPCIQCAETRLGDVILFDTRLRHGSSRNTKAHRYRISIDIRWAVDCSSV